MVVKHCENERTLRTYGSLARMLSTPARYIPYASGRYEIKTGLNKLGTDFGNGARDRCVFQLDTDWPEYRRNKLQARQEQLDKYVVGRASPAVAHRLAACIIDQLLREHPHCFRNDPNIKGKALYCALTDETLHFDHQLQLLRVDTTKPVIPDYRDTLDALACQCQEDVCVIEFDGDGRDHITALHLCFPNYWSAGDKLGNDFIHAHTPVPGMVKIKRQARRLMRSLARQGRYVRFAWGLTTDRRLNHHPLPPPGQDPDDWCGRQFNPADPTLYLRIERQVLVAMPPVNGLLFTIHTYFDSVAQLNQCHRQQLISALHSMDKAALAYKGLVEQKHTIIDYLRKLV